MQPITHETIHDRRQPTLHWSAILAGTAVAVALWGVFQLLGFGSALAALDPDDVRSTHHAALGLGTWSVFAPLIATYVGAFVAARLSATYDRRVAAHHGLVVWGLTTVAGLVVTLWMASAAAMGAAHMNVTDHPTLAQVGADETAIQRDAADALVPINQQLKAQGRPIVTPNALIAAARAAKSADGFDADKFIATLDDRTALDKAGATDVANQLGPRAESFVEQTPLATPREHDALARADAAGKGLLLLGLAILCSIGTALLGAILALRFGRREPHVTAQYPVTTLP